MRKLESRRRSNYLRCVYDDTTGTTGCLTFKSPAPSGGEIPNGEGWRRGGEDRHRFVGEGDYHVR